MISSGYGEGGLANLRWLSLPVREVIDMSCFAFAISRREVEVLEPARVREEGRTLVTP